MNSRLVTPTNSSGVSVWYVHARGLQRLVTLVSVVVGLQPLATSLQDDTLDGRRAPKANKRKVEKDEQKVALWEHRRDPATFTVRRQPTCPPLNPSPSSLHGRVVQILRRTRHRNTRPPSTLQDPVLQRVGEETDLITFVFQKQTQKVSILALRRSLLVCDLTLSVNGNPRTSSLLRPRNRRVRSRPALRKRGTKALKEKKRKEVKKEQRRLARQMTTKTTRPKSTWRMPRWTNCERIALLVLVSPMTNNRNGCVEV